MGIMYVKPKNILVISSNYDFKEVIGRTFAGRGYNTQFAHDFDMAVITARLNAPDTILVDYKLDFMGEDELSRFYTYGGSSVHGKKMLIFTDHNRPTHSVRGKPVEILRTSAIHDREGILGRVASG